MTAMDMPEFSAALKRLGRTMSRVVGEDLVEDYFLDLKEFPLENVHRAFDHVRKTAKYWPRPSVIREACLLVPGVASVTSVPPWVDPVADVFFCSDCDDSGFVRRLECPGDGSCQIAHCGQVSGQSTSHGYTRRCSCVSTNPVMMRERDLHRNRNAGRQAERERA